MNQKHLLALGAAVAGMAMAAPVHAATYTTFDPPGSLNTSAQSVDKGAIVGTQYLNDRKVHGYVRAVD